MALLFSFLIKFLNNIVFELWFVKKIYWILQIIPKWIYSIFLITLITLILSLYSSALKKQSLYTDYNIFVQNIIVNINHVYFNIDIIVYYRLKKDRLDLIKSNSLDLDLISKHNILTVTVQNTNLSTGDFITKVQQTLQTSCQQLIGDCEVLRIKIIEQSTL